MSRPTKIQSYVVDPKNPNKLIPKQRYRNVSQKIAANKSKKVKVVRKT